MKALLLKDFYVVTKQLRIFIFIIPFIALSTGGKMSAFAIFLGASLPMTAIAYDEHSKWNELAIMMPYTKFQLIFSKYMLSYICIIGATLLSMIGQKMVGFYNNWQIVFFAVMGALVFVAINTPIFFKFGSEKGRFMFIGVTALIGTSGSIFSNLDKNIIVKILDNSPLIFISFAILCNVISVFVALNIKQSKV